MTELQPLIDYHDQDWTNPLPHNLGTVVNFAPWTRGRSKRKIYAWRVTHPDLNVFVAYGVNAHHYPDGSWSLGHGGHIGIEGRGELRYYWFIGGRVDWDTLRIPAQIIADWDEGKPNRQMHFPDLKWFDPYYGFRHTREIMSRNELMQEIKYRVAQQEIREKNRRLTE